MRLRFILVAAIAVAILPAVARAQCVTFDDPAELFARNDLVFIGKVVAKEPTGAQGPHQIVEVATFQLERWWKGKVPNGPIRIGADLPFELNKRYLVFAGGDPLSTSLLCRATQRLERAQVAQDWLKQRFPRDRSGDMFPIVLGTVTFGRPTRFAGGVDVLFPIGGIQNEDGVGGARGIEISARTGAGGTRVGGGVFLAGFPFISDLQFVATRTSSHPRVADPKSTYVGAEAGFSVPVWMLWDKMVNFRVGLGESFRVAGEGSDKAMFTWNVGVQVWLWWGKPKGK